MKLLCFVAVLVAVAATEVYGQACHMREIDLCLAIGMFQYQSNGVPGDEEKVNDWCESMKEVGECSGNFSAKCMSPVQREFLSLFRGGEDTGTQLCTPGSELRARYLEHAECISEGAESDEFKSGIKDLQVLVETVFDTPFEKRFPTACCGIRRFHVQTEETTERQCGQEAVEMTRAVIKSLTGNLLDVICERFDPRSEECMDLLPEPGTPPQGNSKSQIGKLLDTMFSNM